MANYTVTITGNRKVESIKQARQAYNAANAAIDGFTPLANNEAYVQRVMSNAVESWKKLYKAEIDNALAPAEAAALAAAQAALEAAAAPD